MNYEYPHVAILVITYNRYKELKQVIDALIDNLSYPTEYIHLIVSDDSTGGNYLSNLSRIKRYSEKFGSFVTMSTPDRSGWGKHVNFALHQIQSLYPAIEYVFQIEDDYVLTRPLDLARGVALLEEKPHIGMLRYRGTGGQRAIYHQFEADINALHPSWDESAGMVQGKTTYLLIDHASQSLYAAYSNGPHLKRFKQWHERYGLYPEGKSLGATEESYAIQVKQLMTTPDAPAIAIFPEWIHMHFQHIGTSWKGSEHDV